MKLLLTSAGLSNESITQAFVTLLEKSMKGVKLAFIPTAANIEPGSKEWLIKDLTNFQHLGFEVDVVDISAVSKDIWLPRLEEAEVIFLGGGNTFHLMHWVHKSGLQDMLPGLLEKRIYAGISAGSCIAGPTIYNSVQNLFGEKYPLKIEKGLGLVEFQFLPHLNNPYFSAITKDNIEQASKTMTEPVYAVDDNSAIVINGEHIEVVSEGEWFQFNTKKENI